MYKKIERTIFGFLWVRCGRDGDQRIDRIKRSILKNGIVEAGRIIAEYLLELINLNTRPK
jgi:hypothetical protein